jgi:hypothetical protein
VARAPNLPHLINAPLHPVIAAVFSRSDLLDQMPLQSGTLIHQPGFAQ